MFHVPEASRLRGDHPLGSDESFGCNGVFAFNSPEPGWKLLVIVSDGRDSTVPEGEGWEHVSVQAGQQAGTYVVRGVAQPAVKLRVPTWKEMCFIKDTFWDEEDVVFQLHPRRSQYVNNHPNVLHLWRHRDMPIPEPPSILVGVLQ